QVVVHPREEFALQPSDGRLQAFRLLTAGRSAAEIHQAAEELFGRLEAILHHQRQRTILLRLERELRGREHTYEILLQRGKRIVACRRRFLRGQRGCREERGDDERESHRGECYLLSAHAKSGCASATA